MPTEKKEENVESRNFAFSVVMAIYNVEEYLNESIDSIINQSLDFKRHIQLILVNDGSRDSSLKIALDYQKEYPNNITVIDKENGGVASARNIGLELAEGDYINFMDSDDRISPNAFEEVYNFFKKHDSDDYDMVSIPVFFFDSRTGPHYLNYKFEESKEDIVDLKETPDFYQIYSHSVFIKKEAVGENRFDSRLINMEDALFVNKIMLNKMKYGLVKNTSYLYRKRYGDGSILAKASQNKDYFTTRLKYLYMELIDYYNENLGYLPEFIQNIFIYDLRFMVEIEDIDEILDEGEKVEFWSYMSEILSHIDEKLIENHRSAPIYAKSFLLYIKNNRDFHIEFKDGDTLLKSGDSILNNLTEHPIDIDIIELEDGYLNISGNFKSNCDHKFISVEAIKVNDGKEERFQSKYVNYPTTERKDRDYLSVKWVYNHNFDVKVPISDEELSKVYLNVIYEENGNVSTKKADIKFHQHAQLSGESHYFIKGDRMLIFANNEFVFVKYSYLKVLKNEFFSLKKMWTERPGAHRRATAFRFFYLICLPFMRKRRIWLFQDRPDVADDNAKHLFKYALNQGDNHIEKYYVLMKDCDDYDEMLKISKNIVPMGSLKHKLLYVFSEKVISSHINHEWLNPFYYKNRRLYSGLSTTQRCFIQHGIILHDLSWWIRRFYHNLHLFLTSAELERESLLGENYNYREEELVLLGLPRYDNLTNANPKRQILFTPTWRKDIKDNKTFLDSQYCKRLNGLINNERLMKSAKENGYEIAFKPHYGLIPFVDLLDTDNVRVATTEPYQDLLNSSSLMITDYSSIAFDFAYLKKPLIYYQGDDYHNEMAYFDYETMGFGDIAYDEEELVDKLIYYMENDCIMEDKFKERVEGFFKFTDRNNCKRVYDWLIKH